MTFYEKVYDLEKKRQCQIFRELLLLQKEEDTLTFEQEMVFYTNFEKMMTFFPDVETYEEMKSLPIFEEYIGSLEDDFLDPSKKIDLEEILEKLYKNKAKILTELTSDEAFSRMENAYKYEEKVIKAFVASKTEKMQKN